MTDSVELMKMITMHLESKEVQGREQRETQDTEQRV